MSAPLPVAASHLVGNYGRNPIAFVRGEGVRLYDAQGKAYLDAFAGVAVSALGHAHPKLVAAIARQAAAVAHVSNHYQIPEQEALAGRLVAAAGIKGTGPLQKVLFVNTGTEANEAAYKTVRLWGNVAHGGRKTRIIAFTGGFHGRTMASLSLTANPKYREPFAPLLPVEFLPFGDFAAASAAFAERGDEIAGVFIEPIQGEGGVIPAPPGYLAHLRALCDRHASLLVLDEVQTGVGRCGANFAFHLPGVVPDILVLAKGLGGGVPIGAIVTTEALSALIKPGLHGTTFGGNPLACAAGLAVTEEIFQPTMLARIDARGEQLRRGLARVFGSAAIEVRGRGLLCGVQLAVEPSTKLIPAAREHGLIVGPSGNSTLRLAPPLIISIAEVDELLERLEAAWNSVKG